MQLRSWMIEELLPSKNPMGKGVAMGSYRFYPPQMRSATVPYEILAAGTAGCQHELLTDGWCDRISVQNGIVFATYTCRHCGRQVCQSLDEVSPPASWVEVAN